MMKKYFCILFVALSFAFGSKAAPGDTTWVQANIAQLSWYGNYDTVTVFPHAGTTTYRRIYMYFTLGKYMCPSGSTYCGDWDYTVLNYLITPGGQSFELARLITPYANAGAPRTPWTWLQPYVFDVTDYAAMLHDTATMRILYSGYSGGFTANIRFAFIEGTPDRNVLGVTRLWNGSYNYGDTSGGGINEINTHFSNLYNVAPAGTKYTNLKFLVTGHGSDANYCNEFCSHNYQILLDNYAFDTETVWRNDCGINELYPQSGTWLYTRANWCPGALVYPHINTLPGIVGGTGFNISLQFDPYISSGGAIYTTEGQLFYYGAYNKSVDASLDDIIAPTNNPNHFRENTLAGTPSILIKNTGGSVINNMVINYQVVGSAMQSYTWTGSLAPEHDTAVVLPLLNDLTAIAGSTVTSTFYSHIVSVNGTTDDDTTNNTMMSQFMPAPVFPNTFKVQFHVGNETISSTSTISEKSWQIYNMNDSIMASRQNVAESSTYYDTVILPVGIYKFQITDSSCDGLNWWVDASVGITGGSCELRTMSGTPLNMHGYYYTGTYSGDFGCVYDQYFVVNVPLGVTEIPNVKPDMIAYPNPATNTVTVNLSGTQADGEIQLTDMLGRVVMTQPCAGGETKLDVSRFANGVYTIVFIENQNPDNRLQTRLVIAK